MNWLIRLLAIASISLSAGAVKAEVDSVARAMAKAATTGPVTADRMPAFSGDCSSLIGTTVLTCPFKTPLFVGPSANPFINVPSSSTDGFWAYPAFGVSPHPIWGDIPGDFTRNSFMFRCQTKYDAQKAEYCTNSDMVTATGAAPNWQTGQTYSAGANVVSNGNLYHTVAGGTSGGAAPSCVAGSCSDGGVLWAYVNIATIDNKVNFALATLANTGAGATWNSAFALTYNSPLYIGSFAVNSEFDFDIGTSQDCAIGFGNCYNIFISGNTAGMGTAAIGVSQTAQAAAAWTATTQFPPHAIVQTTVSAITRIYTSSDTNGCTSAGTPPSGTGTFTDGTCHWAYLRDGNTAWSYHFGERFLGANLVSDVTVFDQTNSTYSYRVTGTHTNVIDSSLATVTGPAINTQSAAFYGATAKIDATALPLTTNELWISPGSGIAFSGLNSGSHADIFRASINTQSATVFPTPGNDSGGNPLALTTTRAESELVLNTYINTGIAPKCPVAGTAVTKGEQYRYSGRIYTVTVNGNTGASCTNGTATLVDSGDQQQGAKASINNATVVGPNGGTTWGIASSVTYNQHVYKGMFGAAFENDMGLGYDEDCVPGDCTLYNTWLTGGNAGTITAYLGIGADSLGANYTSHYGVWLEDNTRSIKDIDILDSARGATGIAFTTAHSFAAISDTSTTPSSLYTAGTKAGAVWHELSTAYNAIYTQGLYSHEVWYDGAVNPLGGPGATWAINLQGTYSSGAINANNLIQTTGGISSTTPASSSNTNIFIATTLNYPSLVLHNNGGNANLREWAWSMGANTLYLQTQTDAHAFGSNFIGLNAATGATELFFATQIDGALTLGSTLTEKSVAIASLPSCAAGSLGAEQLVSNGTAYGTGTYGSAVSATGAVTRKVLCTNTAGATTYAWAYN